tara:strand:+ start:760 stop:2121 length:1362 start_codon:yes stop_codon:yes gene_type:complete
MQYLGTKVVRVAIFFFALIAIPVVRAEEVVNETADTLDLVILSMGLNILIAAALLWFIIKHKDNFVQNRLFLSIIALLFFANGLLFAAESLVQLKGASLSNQFVVFLSMLTISMDFYTAMLFPIIFVLFPSPIFTQRKHLITFGVLVALTYLVLLTIGIFELLPMAGIIFLSNIIMLPAFLIPIRWYLLYRDSPLQIERNHAVAAAMLGIGILISQGMFSWPSLFIFGGETLVGGLTGLTSAGVSDTVSWTVVFNHSRFIMTSMFLLYIVFKELTVSKEIVSPPLRLVALTVFFVGIANAMVRGLVDDPLLSALWEFFAIRGTYGLVRPLIIVYLLLKFNLINMGNPEVRKVARLVALVLISVWVAMVFEIFQAFLPIPQLLSAAIIGVVLAFLIGWEDRVFEDVARESEDSQLSIIDEFVEQDDVSRFIALGLLTMIIGCFLAFVISGMIVS